MFFLTRWYFDITEFFCASLWEAVIMNSFLTAQNYDRKYRVTLEIALKIRHQNRHQNRIFLQITLGIQVICLLYSAFPWNFVFFSYIFLFFESSVLHHIIKTLLKKRLYVKFSLAYSLERDISLNIADFWFILIFSVP